MTQNNIFNIRFYKNVQWNLTACVVFKISDYLQILTFHDYSFHDLGLQEAETEEVVNDLEIHEDENIFDILFA